MVSKQQDVGRMSRTLVVVGAVLAALVLAVGVAVVVTLNGMTAAVQEQDYRQCMADAGVYEADNPDDMVRMAKVCHAGVYDEETTP